jgi:hypothetical protein
VISSEVARSVRIIAAFSVIITMTEMNSNATSNTQSRSRVHCRKSMSIGVP